MTDFGPIIANPKTLLLVPAPNSASICLFAALLGFDIYEAACIGIIGGADGPTTIYLTNRLAPTFIGATGGSLYLYGAGTDYSAADYKIVHHQKEPPFT